MQILLADDHAVVRAGIRNALRDLPNLEIIDEVGYPGKSMVGDQSGTAFLVIQHADLEVQEKYLDIITEHISSD